VLFDAVGTLICPDPPVAQAYHAHGKRFGSRLTCEEVGRRFHAAFARQEAIDTQPSDQSGRHTPCAVRSVPSALQDADGTRSVPATLTGPQRERQRWQAIVAEVFDDVADRQGLFEALWSHFADPRSWAVYRDVADAWSRLTSAGLSLGVASNFDDRLDRVCDGLPPLCNCRWRFVSSQLGCRKPNPAFFAAIEQALHLKPHQLLLVGDDLMNDYHAARSAGWHAVLLVRDGSPLHSGIPQIATLAELS
jgi:putative hydrolase of the HAD superfamily